MKRTINQTINGLKSRLLSTSLAAGSSLLLMFSSAQAQYTWPVYEPFGEYFTDPQRLGLPAESGTNWNFGNSGTTGVSSFIITNAAAMTYPALLAETNLIAKGVQAVPNTGSADRGALITPQTGTWYASFLLNYQNNGGAVIDRSIFQMGTGALINDSFTRVYTAVWLTPDYRLRLTKNFNAANLMSTADFSAPTPVVATNIPHLVVMRYVKVPGSQDRVDLWVDPTPFGDNANIPPPLITTSNAPNIASFNGFAMSNRRLNGAASVPPNVFRVDEVRLGDTWASVTPLATPAPGPIFAVTGGGIACPGDDLHVGLSGSVSTNEYLLYTNGVHATTLPGTGSALDFGVQTTLGIYSVLASNIVTADIGWMSNSVNVAVTQPPIIVTEPKPVLTTTNNWAEFKAIVTGDALSYQWYRNGAALVNDAHITGATTAHINISPVTSADIGDYYLVVTNTCSAVATTTTNSLNLHAPDELIWAGDAFNINVWDIYAAVAEWTGGTGFFNPGDNVTFDDTYTFANAVTLNGFLTPSKITVNAARDYRWAGTGTLAGPAKLVKDGAGTLIIDNNPANTHMNTFTGGTIISNGVVNITNSWWGLGSGPVTLAGGTLRNWQKGSAGGPGAEQGLTNDLVLVANSTWLLDRTGDQAAAFLGGFTVNPGLTLTFNHIATNQNSVNRVRIGSVFTNNLNIVATADPLATNSPLDIGSYNNTGAQVYNGVINGANTGFLVVGTGGVYLNGANTFTRDTTTFVGFLAGSGSINGRLVVNSGTTIGAGSQTSIGTFTVNSNVVLNGNVRIRVDKSLVQSNDLISATGYITNGSTGTITITNIGAAPIAAGDTFKIFSSAISNAAALVVTDGGNIAWANNLGIDGTVQALSVIPSYSTNLSYSVSGNNLTINWPATHLGWILQSQTNSLTTGINPAGTWHDLSGSATVTSNSILVNPANPTVFYRLRHP